MTPESFEDSLNLGYEPLADEAYPADTTGVAA